MPQFNLAVKVTFAVKETFAAMKRLLCCSAKRCGMGEVWAGVREYADVNRSMSRSGTGVRQLAPCNDTQ